LVGQRLMLITDDAAADAVAAADDGDGIEDIAA
jgi:hypothetical protein